MNYDIIDLKIQNEMDLVLAYKRAKQISGFTGMQVATQTKFATAVSEICRNVLEHAGEGDIYFSILEKNNSFLLEAKVIDFGKGIHNLNTILELMPSSSGQKGTGIYNARKLVNQFNIVSNESRGTKVTMGINVPVRGLQINKKIVEAWKESFANEKTISPYEEIRMQNIQLLDMMEALQHKNMEIENKVQEISALNDSLDQFAHTVSHDLKAPLNNIEALIMILEENVKEKDFSESAEVCNIINKQLVRMYKLIDEILLYSQMGKKKIEKQTINIGDLVKEVVEMLTVPKGIQIKVQEDLPILEVEAILLKQIFSNLISNGIKYHDKPVGLVKVGVENNITHYTFYVEDDGPGIPKESHQRIFNIFESLATNTKSSTGVGLSIVKKIIEEKGGEVWIESEGRGSKFIFTWPI